MKKLLFILLTVLVLLVLSAFGYAYFQTMDRHPGYEVDILIKNNLAGRYSSGFGKQSITPELIDQWEDKDKNGRYQPEEGDSFTDVNGNGQFDAVWIAGFHNSRPAQSIHDSLWARAMVLDDQNTRLALVALDAIGYGSDGIIDIRKSIPEDWNIDYCIISSTHTHQAPDVIGLWGEGDFKSGVDPGYMEMIKTSTLKAIEKALASMEPATAHLGIEPEAAVNLVTDSRQPIVMDPALKILAFEGLESGKALGNLVQWSNHPETVWSRNLELSSDFPHYLREGIEKGVYHQDSLIKPGIGGISVYVNGAIGGLMTTDPDFPIPDPFTDDIYLRPTFAKVEAQGKKLALLALEALEKDSIWIAEAGISLSANSFSIPLDNPLYKLAAITGILDRGTSSWMKIRTEVSYWTFGPIAFMHYPGELYPEILHGLVEQPEGGDFGIAPVETPALKTYVPKAYFFNIGLSNDMIGYIIPKSQWDEEPPFTYGRNKAPYGEINSVGPNTGPLVYQALVDCVQRLEGAQQ